MAVVSQSHDEVVARPWSGAQPAGLSGGLTAALLAAPGLAIGALDAAARHEQIAGWSRSALAQYAATLTLGALLWGALVAASSARRAWGSRALLALAAALAIGAQLYFFARYHAYLNPRAVLVGTAMLPSVGQQLWLDRVSFARALLPPVVLALFSLAAPSMVEGLGANRARDRAHGRSRSRPSRCSPRCSARGRRRARRAGRDTGRPLPGRDRAASPRRVGSTTIGSSAPTLARARPRPSRPCLAPAATRSVLFIVTESVRATDACSVPSSGCATTPYTNALLPERFGFSQMRALDSTTAVSLAVLWSGRPATASRQALHKAPLLWEYARAAGFDTAYWTSQNMFFANSGTWLEGLPLSRWVSATDLDPDPTYEIGADDAKLVDRVLRDLPAMVAAAAPFVGVVHLSNTHSPYVIDDADAPSSRRRAASATAGRSACTTATRDADIRRQDAIVARLVQPACARCRATRSPWCA